MMLGIHFLFHLMEVLFPQRIENEGKHTTGSRPRVRCIALGMQWE